MRRTRVIAVYCAAVLTVTLAFSPLGARSAGPLYAIKGATIHTSAGPVITNGTIVLRNGLIEDIGASITAPADALVIDAAGLHMYPGLIDMDNAAPIEGVEAQAAAGGGGGRGGGGGAAAPAFATLEEAERAKRTAIMRPHYMSAENLRPGTPALQALASAGVTTVLAVPSQGIFKGQSALVNVAIPPDDPQISTIADYRGGLAVVKSPVAMHVNMSGRGGGQGYPGALLGTVAFTKQGFLDAQWQRDAQTQYQRAGAKGPRPIVEPALDALKPALAKQMPVAFDVNEAREIDRALAMATEYGLDPIVVGAQYAAERKAELAAAKARVILSLNFPGGGGGGAAQAGGGGGGGRGGGGATSLRTMKFQADAPKVPAVLAQASVPFAFTSGGATPVNFVRNAGRVIKEGGLAADAVLRALTIDAARMAGAADRIGSLEKGKIANLVVTEGDLFDGGRVRHVFIDGRPVEVVEPARQRVRTPAEAAGGDRVQGSEGPKVRRCVEVKDLRTFGPLDPWTFRVLAGVALAAAVFFVYAGALSAFFFEDDFQLLVGSWNFDPANLLYLKARFKPVFEIYFWLGSAVFGRSTVGFHAASLAVHVVNGWLVLAIARRLGMRPVFAFLTALLFVVQPAYVAAVAWVGAIAESLVVLFGCTSAYAVLRFRESGRRAWLAAAIVSFSLALFSHESAVVFLPIVFLIDHVAAGRGWPGRDLLRISWPFVLVTGAYLAMTFTANTPEYLGDEISYRPGVHVIRNVFEDIAALYVGERKVLSHLMVAAVLAAVVWKGSTRARLGVAWMVLGILPFAPFETGILSRYAYVPAIGLAILLGEGLASLHAALARRSSGLARGVVIALSVLICARFAYFARDGVKDVYQASERYRVFLADLRRERPELPDHTVLTISPERDRMMARRFVEAAVHWEYRNQTLRVEVGDAGR